MKIKATIMLLLFLISVVMISGCSEKNNDTENNKADESAASETAQMQQDAEENGSEEADVSEEDRLLSEPYVEMMTQGKFFIHYTSTDVLDGEATEAEYKMAYDDKKLYMSMVSEDFSMTTISNESTMYLIDDASKTYYKMSVSEDEMENTDDEELMTENEYVFVGVGENKLGGKNLYYEEYTAGSGSLVRYYFDGDKLYAIEGITDGESSVMYIIEMTDNVDPSLFSVPDDYSEMSLE
ncbi:MAG: hypothetical protein IJG50_05715 [Clostridia bacterium]|nr:hypothetical protein [Clostridia bacterium]